MELKEKYLELKPDIILLQSHNIRDPNVPIKIPGYIIHKRNRRQERAADGVAIAIRRQLSYTLIDNFVDEFLAITVNTATGPITIGTCYLPPRRAYLPYPDLMRLINRQEPVYVLADMNPQHPSIGSRGANTVGTSLNQLLVASRITHLGPNFNTWANQRKSGRPDIVISNSRNHHCHHIAPGPLTTSDHLPLIMTISCDPIMLPTPNRFLYKKADWEKYTAHISSATQPVILDGLPTHTIEDALETWYETLLEAKRLHIPQTNLRPIPHPKPSHRLRTLQVALQAVWERGNLLQWPPDVYQQLKQLQRQLIIESQRLLEENWMNQMLSLTADYKDPKIWWREIRRLSGDPRTANVLKTRGNRTIVDPVRREELLSEHWEKVWQISPEENARFDRHYEAQLRARHPNAQTDLAVLPTIDLRRLDGVNLITTPITADEVRADIKAIKHGKAPGYKGVTKDDLTHLPGIAVAQLTTIFNAAFASGHWPSIFRHALVHFIPKKGQPMRVDTQRPISLLEIPGKLLERCICRRLTEHLELGGYLSPSQYGFRQRRGTGRALALLWERASYAVAQCYHSNIQCRDVEKAYDKIWHDGVRFRLLDLHVPQALARLLANFLRDRTAAIRVEGHIGPPIPLRSGVPQGSVLSPILYIAYTSDTPEPEPPSKLSSFADDNLLQNMAPNHNRYFLVARTVRATAAQDDYEFERKISTNHTKDSMLSVARRAPGEVIVRGRQHQYSAEVKCLGLRMNSHGFKPQVRYNCRKASAALGKLKRFRAIPWKHKRRLYTAFVRPVLEYPSVPLHAGTDRSMKQLQAVQNSAIMWITGLRFNTPGRLTIQQLHGRLNLEPVNVRLHRLGKKVWESLEDDRDPNFVEVEGYAATPQRRRPALGADPKRWWPSSLNLARGPQPNPIWKTRQMDRH